jgi:hypothetical protein
MHFRAQVQLEMEFKESALKRLLIGQGRKVSLKEKWTCT